VPAIEREAKGTLVRDEERFIDLKGKGDGKDLEALAAQIVKGIMATVQHLK